MFDQIGIVDQSDQLSISTKGKLVSLCTGYVCIASASPRKEAMSLILRRCLSHRRWNQPNSRVILHPAFGLTGMAEIIYVAKQRAMYLYSPVFQRDESAIPSYMGVLNIPQSNQVVSSQSRTGKGEGGIEPLLYSLLRFALWCSMRL